MAEGGPPLGEIRIDFTGNLKPLEAAAAQAGAVAQGAATKAAEAATGATGSPITPQIAAASTATNAATQATTGLNAALKEQAQGIRESVGGFLSLERVIFRFVGVIGILGGAVTAAIAGFVAMGSWISKLGYDAEVTGRKLADPLIKELDKLSAARPAPTVNLDGLKADADRLKVIDQSIRDEMSSMRKGIAGNQGQDEASQIRIDRLNQERKQIVDRFEAARAQVKLTADLSKQQNAIEQEHYDRIKSYEQRDKDGREADLTDEKRQRDEFDKSQRDEAERHRRESEEDLDYRLAKEEQIARAIEQQNTYLAQQARIYGQIRDQASTQFGAENILLDSLNQINDTLQLIASQRRGEVI